MESHLLSVLIKRSAENSTRFVTNGFLTDNIMNNNPKLMGNSLEDNRLDSTSTNDGDNSMGTPSDYILIGMIVLLALCVAICCLCLFCRTSSHCTICGFNFEVNDRTPSVAGEDLSELHEVVPLTPTTIGTYNIPDIETKLQGDPPPPKYSDVASPTNLSMLERFKRKSKRRGGSASEDKSGPDLSVSNKPSDSFNRGKNKHSVKQHHSSHRIFQRSSSCQHPRVSSLKSGKSSSLPSTDGGKSSRAGGFFSSLKPHSSFQHNVSDCTPTSYSGLSKEEASDQSSVHRQLLSPSKVHEDPENVLSLKNDVIHEEPEPPTQESSNEVYDDEVFV